MFQHKLEEVYSETNRSYRVPGHLGRYQKMIFLLPESKVLKIQSEANQPPSFLTTTARQLANFIGLRQAVVRAFRVSLLLLGTLQRVLIKYLIPESSKKSNNERKNHLLIGSKKGDCCGGRLAPSPSLKIAKVDTGLSTRQGDPFG